MNPIKTFVKYSFLAFLLALVSLLTFLFFFFDPNDYQEPIKELAKTNAGLEIETMDLQYKLTSPNYFSIRDFKAKLQGKELQFASFMLRFRWMPLVGKILVIPEMRLDDFQGGDKKSSLEGLNLVLQNLQINLKEEKPLPESFSAYGDVKALLSSTQKLENMTFEVEASNKMKKVDLVFLKIKSLGEEMKASAQVNLLEEQALQTQFVIEKIDLQKVAELKKDLKVTPVGMVDVNGELAWAPFTSEKALLGEGEVLVQGKNLKAKGMDMDRLLESLAKTLQTDWLDVVGFVTLGPLGTLVSSAWQAGNAVPGLDGGETQVTELYTQLGLSDGKVEFKDVALSTKKERVAVKGKVNLIKEEFEGLKAAILDKDGCAIFTQEVKGSFEKPDLGAFTAAANSILNPVKDLLKKASEIIVECTPFYRGQVQHP